MGVGHFETVNVHACTLHNLSFFIRFILPSAQDDLKDKSGVKTSDAISAY